MRDSTLAAAGAGNVWLARLGADSGTVIDSTTFSVFASEVEWAGDTLLLTFGFSGLKLVPASGDRFSAPAQTYSDGGLYEYLRPWVPKNMSIHQEEKRFLIKTSLTHLASN